MNSRTPGVAPAPKSISESAVPSPARALTPRWLIGLLLFLWLAWICFLIWAGRNDWNTTRPPDPEPPVKAMPAK